MLLKETPLIKYLESFVENVHGWSPIEQLYSLYMLVLSTNCIEGDIVEIGSWCGRTSIAMGLAINKNSKTKIYAVDLFPNKNDWFENQDNTFSFSVAIDNQKYYGCKNQTVWKEPFFESVIKAYEDNESLIDQFRRNVISRNLSDRIIPFKGNSNLFFNDVNENFRCKLAFIDGEHSYEALKEDIKNVEKYLIDGGWICFDDVLSGYDGVDKAIEELIINNDSYVVKKYLTRKFFIAQKGVS